MRIHGNELIHTWAWHGVGVAWQARDSGASFAHLHSVVLEWRGIAGVDNQAHHIVLLSAFVQAKAEADQSEDKQEESTSREIQAQHPHASAGKGTVGGEPRRNHIVETFGERSESAHEKGVHQDDQQPARPGRLEQVIGDVITGDRTGKKPIKGSHIEKQRGQLHQE